METGILRGGATALAAACMLGFALPGIAAQNDNIEVSIEQPVDRGFTTGIGIIRGWAAAPDGIDRVELFIDEDPDTGEPNQVLGFGGSREGICGIPRIASYPECSPEARPGFASAFNFNLLTDGEHEFTVRAYDTNGDHNDDSHTFTSRSLGEEFIGDDERIELPAFVIDGLRKHNPGSDPDQSFDIEFVWNTASQRFVMSRITEESPLPFIILNPPTGLSATTDSGNVELTWTAGGAPGQPARWFVIERKFNNVAVSTEYEVIGVVRQNTTSFTDENVSLSVPLLPGTYTYRVVAALPWTTEESGEVSVDQTQNDLIPDPDLPDPGLDL